MGLIESLKSARILMRIAIRHLELLLVGLLILVAAVQYYVRPQSQSLSDILKTGQLRVLIADEPDSQYVFNRQHYGFEYELLEAFAKDLGVELKLEVVPYGELFNLLDSGAGDMAVGGIIDSPFVNRVSSPSIAWYQAKATVTYRRGTKRPKRIADLGGEPVLASSRYFEIGGIRSLNLVDDHRSEYTLLSAVDQGLERYVLSVNYRALNAKHYLPNLNRSFILPESLDLVWALPKRADPPLLIRLAIAYQESRWSNEATSPTGVRGIMQLTNDTAQALGVDDRMDMNQSIDAAAVYIKQLKDRLPKKIKDPQRTWFAVGAYNLGMKHIIAAYRKAREQGLDRTQWQTISELLPTLYDEPFERGVQAQKYVERVQIFTDIMRFYDIHQRDNKELKEGVIRLASAI